MQPKNLQTLKQTTKPTNRIKEKFGQNILQTPQNTKTPIPKTKSKLKPKTPEPKIAPNSLPHFPTLESNHGIPQNQRHPPRHADTRTQKHHEHTQIHTTH